MSRFLRDIYSSLKPYTPGEQPRETKLIKLNTNESPFPPSPKTAEAISGAEIRRLNLYPDPDASALISAVSEYYHIREDRIMLGNGSDELLAFSFMIFQSQTRNVYFPEISYGFYKVYAEVFGAQANQVRLDDNLMIKLCDYHTLDGMIVIANPNAPTGAAVSLEEIENVLKTNQNNLVLVDEAYVNFGAESSLQLIDKYDNLLVIQTFSKSRNLAGARIGMAFGNEEIIKDLNKIKYSFNPYNLNRLSILAGVAAIKDDAYFKECMEKIKRTRAEFTADMEALDFFVIPSLANFVFAKSGAKDGRGQKISGEAYYKALKDRNILVRHFEHEKIRDYVRITIGKKEEMDALIEATRDILKANKDDA